MGLQWHMHILLLGCPELVTERAKKEEMYNTCHVFKSCLRQCDKNAAISALRRLISLFKYSAEEEARICDGGRLGRGRGWVGGAEWLRV